MSLRPRSSSKSLFTALAVCASLTARAGAAPTAAYPQPQPSAQEQYLLELINAARANPAAEGQRLAGVTDPEIVRYYNYYKVSLSRVVGDFSSYAAKPPLAFNTALMASSRQQSLYLASAGVQSHNSADGSSFDKRISATGYPWSGLGENIYAYSEGTFFAHVGLLVDWGVPSLDHRENALNTNASIPTFREIGISCVPTSLKNFGPYVITEDFGTPADRSVAYLTGVVYSDANGNGGYDEGEGCANVTVSPASGTYYAITAASGGFVIPLPATGSGTLTVTASGGGLGGARSKTISYNAGTNVKVDFTSADAAGPALPVVTISAPVKIASANGTTAQITVARAGDTSDPLQVALAFGGTAVNGVDSNPLPATVTIPAGAESIDLPVQSRISEPATIKKLKVHVVENSGYAVSPASATAKTKVKLLPEN